MGSSTREWRRLCVGGGTDGAMEAVVGLIMTGKGDTLDAVGWIEGRGSTGARAGGISAEATADVRMSGGRIGESTPK